MTINNYKFNKLIKSIFSCLVQEKIAFLFLCFPFFLNAQVKFSLDLQDNGKYRIRIESDTGFDHPPNELLKVYTKKAAKIPNLPAINGQYELLEYDLYFKPNFDFRPKVDYVAIFMESDSFFFKIPEKTNLTVPKVVAIYPSAEILPSNILKFYVTFNQAMSEGDALKYIDILDTQGNKLENIFLELQPELWNKQQTRLTLWVNPGRVKRALGPNEDLGPAFEKGKIYQLVVRPGWKDTNSTPIHYSFVKNFKIKTADRESPDPQNWKIVKPIQNTEATLKIDFKESLDYALAPKCFSIYSKDGEVAGFFKVSHEEKLITFYPQKPWEPGKYEIKIDTRLEDLAANNLNRLFDSDLAKLKNKKTGTPYLFLHFEVED